MLSGSVVDYPLTHLNDFKLIYSFLSHYFLAFNTYEALKKTSEATLTFLFSPFLELRGQQWLYASKLWRRYIIWGRIENETQTVPQKVFVLCFHLLTGHVTETIAYPFLMMMQHDIIHCPWQELSHSIFHESNRWRRWRLQWVTYLFNNCAVNDVTKLWKLIVCVLLMITCVS